MRISIKELQKGMIINADIFSKKGALLLYKGFKVENPELVSIVLKRNEISEIEIREEETSKGEIEIVESEDLKERIEHEVNLFKEEFSEVIESLKGEVLAFKESKDISSITDLEKGAEIAKEHENSVLTIFQLVEEIKRENKDEYSNMLETSLISYSLGKWLGFNENELKEICEASLLSSILAYVGFDKELKIKEMLSGLENISEDVLEGALSSHERTDGSGYPKGLTKDDIHPYARVIGVAEVYQLLTTENELRKKLSAFEAVKLMEREYITKLDVKTLYVFLHRIGSKFIGSSVRLSDGNSGEIVFVPENEVSMPYIKLKDGKVINLQSDEHKDKIIIEIF